MGYFLKPKIRFLLAGSVLLMSTLPACATANSQADERMSLIHKSRTLLSIGQIQQSRALTQKIIALYGPSPFLLNQMAILRERQGRRKMALRILTHAHHLYPDSQVLTLNLATAELARRDPFLAKTTLRPLLDQKLWPNGFRTLMGRIDLETGNLTEAHLFLHEALARHPDNPLLLANMGLLHRRMGLRKKAQNEFKRALDRTPRGPLRNRLKALLASR